MSTPHTRFCVRPSFLGLSIALILASSPYAISAELVQKKGVEGGVLMVSEFFDQSGNRTVRGSISSTGTVDLRFNALTKTGASSKPVDVSGLGLAKNVLLGGEVRVPYMVDFRQEKKVRVSTTWDTVLLKPDEGVVDFAAKGGESVDPSQSLPADFTVPEREAVFRELQAKAREVGASSVVYNLQRTYMMPPNREALRRVTIDSDGTESVTYRSPRPDEYRPVTVSFTLAGNSNPGSKIRDLGASIIPNPQVPQEAKRVDVIYMECTPEQIIPQAWTDMLHPKPPRGEARVIVTDLTTKTVVKDYRENLQCAYDVSDDERDQDSHAGWKKFGPYAIDKMKEHGGIVGTAIYTYSTEPIERPAEEMRTISIDGPGAEERWAAVTVKNRHIKYVYTGTRGAPGPEACRLTSANYLQEGQIEYKMSRHTSTYLMTMDSSTLDDPQVINEVDIPYVGSWSNVDPNQQPIPVNYDYSCSVGLTGPFMVEQSMTVTDKDGKTSTITWSEVDTRRMNPYVNGMKQVAIHGPFEWMPVPSSGCVGTPDGEPYRVGSKCINDFTEATGATKTNVYWPFRSVAPVTQEVLDLCVDPPRPAPSGSGSSNN